ncbi:Hypothetical predicted protein [Podarcis lilfordi]|uniref:Uncharacterized protein n=1 Tax=Podarcis lilfordi TaxID=74358 RepID=A0AA35PBT3_9SAUR|nr:Hypothetical predicted protein [Podarcis lilfordi]
MEERKILVFFRATRCSEDGWDSLLFFRDFPLWTRSQTSQPSKADGEKEPRSYISIENMNGRNQAASRTCSLLTKAARLLNLKVIVSPELSDPHHRFRGGV